MNKNHRTIWNEARACFVVAQENSRSNGRSSSLTRSQRPMLFTAMSTAISLALPLAGNVQANEITANSTQIYHLLAGSMTIDAGVTIGAITNITEIEATGTDSGTITNHGVILSSTMSEYAGIHNSGTLGAIINTGTISGNYGIVNTGTLTVLNNSGQINGSGASAFTSGIGIKNAGFLGTLTNTGTISGYMGIQNNGNINSLTNNALISGSHTGLVNYGTIGTLNNTGTISGGVEIDSGGIITTLNNSGTISGGVGIGSGTITTLNNSGTISGGVEINSGGTITTLNNTGTISGQTAIQIQLGSIQTLTNSGQISGSQYAILNTDSLHSITNSGTIAGNIENVSGSNLTISNDNASTFGTLTGYSNSVGTLTNTASNLVFASGNILLNDNINVGSHTVSNVASTLKINNHVTITGNYSQSSAATLLFGVADGATSAGSTSDTGYGRLYVTGNTTLASGSTISLSKTGSTYAFASGQRYVLIVTSGTANYNTSLLNYSISGYSGSITGSTVTDGSNTDLLITLASSSSSTPTNYATNGVAAASLHGLFSYTGTNASLLNVFNSAAAVGSSSGDNTVGAQLSPTSVSSSLVQAAASATQAVATVAYEHMDGLRSGNGSGGSGVATGEHSYDVGIWGRVFGGHASQSERESISGYRANYSGLVLGADALVSERVRAGGLFSYTRTNLSNTDDNAGSSSSANSYGLSAYASYNAEPWYVNALLGVTKQQFSTVRDINYTGFSGIANGSFNGLQYTSSLQAGYPLNVEHWLPGVRLTPLAGLSYSSVRQNGYTESGGNGAALTVNAASTSSLKSELAVRMETDFASSYGKLTPLAQLGWRHEYHDSRLRSNAIFADDTTGTSGFTTQSASPISNTGALTLGLTLEQSKNLTIAARYSLEVGSGYTDQAAGLQLRWQY